ncbi:MAG: hypothetical protein M1148_02060 [Candidatus Thermoplasmatota archaeon]|nr:hypothetical protein [Candidatus Thermoplasmatota archaeon]
MPTSDGKKVEKEEKENITVKGVSQDVFGRIKELARVTGKTMGEITNEAYGSVLSTFEATKTISREFLEGTKSAAKLESVSGFKNLTVSGEDLKELGKKVIFRDIENLTLENMDDEVFREFVLRIIHVKNLKVTDAIKKSSVITKCHYVDNVEFV